MKISNGKKMTRSKEDYLKVLLFLSNFNTNIRSSDVANELGISRASVTRMMMVFKESGYIIKENYGTIVLIKQGKARFLIILYLKRT